MNTFRDLKFPQHFLFGSAVAAFQVEGALGKRTTDWDIFLTDHPGIVKPNEKGPEWWIKSNAKKDISTMHSLGLGVQRISIEWGRIEPQQGNINQEALTYYKTIIAFMQSTGISPMVTINHYTLPEWVAKNGGWSWKNINEQYLQFVELLVAQFPEVKYWVTLNEPNFLLYAGYVAGAYPPQKSSLFTGLQARSAMIIAHKKAYAIIKKCNPDASVGVAFALRWYPPENPHDPLEVLYAKIIDYIDNTNLISAMQPADFIGCNYYTGYFLNLDFTRLHPTKKSDIYSFIHTKIFGQMKTPDAYVSDYGWPIVPVFFLELLRSLYRSFKLPIFVTENGIADNKDTYRSFYILTHLVALWRALQEGIPITQYIHWSTIDNLEWLEGYRMHFGLIHYNEESKNRRLARSAQLYKDIATTKTIAVDNLIKTYLPAQQQIKANEIITELIGT